MKLRLLRNATLKLEVAGRTVLIDPFFAPRHSRPANAGRSRNPLVDLPTSTDDILDGVELVIVSHLHSDHFDSVAQSLVPKQLPLISQPGDEDKIRSFGFENVTPLTDTIDWQGIRLTRRDGQHGFGPVIKKMGPVIGFSIEASREPTLYWSGDTVFYPPVEATIRDTRPDIIVIHPCGALWEGEQIAMDAEQAVAVCNAAPEAIVVATHLDSLDHATVGRADLRQHALTRGISAAQLRIPDDGQTLEFGATIGARHAAAS
ncbi:L-ascorbate metabolism protein UlaG (beta-lactamase superfamily) [Bradyrhizobium sp. USDA 4524]|uniref:MBL fold metallo-hydrolase n=1 Tax=unclassified Bradyrhizobium TaxID=2631580 RepID=UPI0020A1A6EE|nr:MULTISPECIES: MBL fold metallo-hydrolase [unclassified Bradyrhizobium]MCP1845811.1 L-ascorbate metabolism protein UlaG (beta-lactamase superfamily) [Bradyrhizobium sp. USDA 4538]MCP1906866.1 L-ascorbate metabolism protein UlaG (beta-lactamase superfamily) [Bradyrhizobium sp. USDA 4537]MCP1985341.1 L-ascorbate metabolism protein UlaG (beta-lactamase superfamily) [Bradyrhizobium sp. USDA 4539]